MVKKSIIQIVGFWVSAGNIAVPLILDAEGLFPNWHFQYHILFGFVAMVLFATWRDHDKQMQIDDLRNRIRLTARPGSLAINMPNQNPPLAPDEVSIDASIQLEVFSDIDVHTSGLVLNLVGVRRVGFPKRLIGIRPNGQDTSAYQEHIKHDNQPFVDNVNFSWRGDYPFIRVLYSRLSARISFLSVSRNRYGLSRLL